MRAIEPTLEIQETMSAIPRTDQWLIESFAIKADHYLCLYPFEGRLVHEGLGSVIAYRLTRKHPLTLAIAANEYGILFTAKEPIPVDSALLRELICKEGIQSDLLESVNATELCKRQFREIARIAGLIHPGIPGQPKKGRHLQASSNMFFDAFREFDPNNLLLEQSRREVLSEQMEIARVLSTIERMERSTFVWKSLRQPSPLAFPLIVEQLRQRVSSDSLEARIAKLQKSLLKFS
jgi:ATP-dependent helicase Lhr and Lhr-like helicase